MRTLSKRPFNKIRIQDKEKIFKKIGNKTSLPSILIPNNPIAAFLFNLNSIIEALKQTLCKNDPIEILILLGIRFNESSIII